MFTRAYDTVFDLLSSSQPAPIAADLCILRREALAAPRVEVSRFEEENMKDRTRNRLSRRSFLHTAGGSLAAPIWAQMVAQAGVGSGGVPWTPPPGVQAAELERVTGRMADETTPPEARYTEYFLGGTEPLPVRLDTWGVFRGRRSAIR